MNDPAQSSSPGAELLKENIPASPIKQNENKKKPASQKSKYYLKIYLMQFVIALITSLLVIILLIIVNPPLTQTKSSDIFVTQSQSIGSVLIAGLATFIITFGVTEAFRWIKI